MLVSSLAAAEILGAVAGLPEAAAGGPGRCEPPEILRDFMIQNACLDRAGVVLEGLSPVDGDRRCVAQRDLRPGENLPYHKHDHPARNGQTPGLRGYQRHDSFPVETAAFGIVVEHSFDFGGSERRKFGVFDGGNGDGGDITLLSPGEVSFAATEDGGAGFQLFVGPDCQGDVNAAALSDSWLIARADPPRSASPHGQAIAHLNDLKEGRQESCPTRLDAAFTRWYVRPVRYRAADGQGAPFTLTTLISEHYGGGEPGSADHVERFYFTRELGSTRWERWQNLSSSRALGGDQPAKTASDLAISGRCSKADIPSGGAPLVMVDCREWTLIVPPDNPAGDRAQFFINAVRSRHLAANLFAAPNSPR